MSFNVEHIADLASLRLSDTEKQQVTDKMIGILDFVQTITNLDLNEHHASVSSYELPTVLREDTVGKTLSNEELVVNVPKLDDSSIIVPQVIQR